MNILIKNGTVVLGNESKKTDIYIENGKIAELGTVTKKADKVLDAKGKIVLAGLVDMHCHLREPGFEYKEDILSGTHAAVKGGFTSVCCMPNTKPVNDNRIVTSYIVNKAREANKCRVYPIGSISKGQKGEELAEILSMKEEGIIAVSDDGVPVTNGNLFKLCLEYIAPFDILAITHCEDKMLADGGVVNEGLNATLCGLKGQIKAAEEAMVSRDILIAENLGTKVHIAHISTAGSVDLVRNAKLRGVKVTAETCPHYIVGDDSMILGYDTSTKVNPPLRAVEDVKAIIEGLKDGTIDAIATDHAPHHADEKNVEYNIAAFGISGFETAFSLCYTSLVKSGILSIEKLSKLMSFQPAKILGLNTGEIAVGKNADLIIVDTDTQYKIDKAEFVSKGKNTPFHGREVYGEVLTTIVEGEIKWAKN